MDTQLERINQIVIGDARRLFESFVKEAIADWDSGETIIGSFPLYVTFYITKKWEEFVRLN